MLYHHYCNFRHNTADLFSFFVYVLKIVTQYLYFNNNKIYVTFSCQKFGLPNPFLFSIPTLAIHNELFLSDVKLFFLGPYTSFALFWSHE